MAEPTYISARGGRYPRIGVNNCDDCGSTPVISDGEEQVWAVSRFGGDRAWLQIGKYEAAPNGDQAVAGIPGIVPPFQWTLERVNFNLPVETYYIINPADGRAWTLTSDAPETQVTLTDLDRGNQAQWFDFNFA